MVFGTYRDLFTAIATTAGALTGLLFVALSVTVRPVRATGSSVIPQVRAAAAMLAFGNALAVSLFSLVPGTNAGYPATVLGVIGVLFTAAAVRSIRTSRAAPAQQLRQLGLIAALLLIFGAELISGIVLLAGPRRSTPVQVIGYALVTSLIVGIARAWELVGDRDTGITASIAVLTGRTSGLGAPADGTVPGSAPADAPALRPDPPPAGGTSSD